MSEAEQTAWHALTADEAVATAQDQRDGGPRRFRSHAPPGGIRPERAADRAQARSVHAFPAAVQQCACLCAARRRLHQADDEPVAGRLDHPRRGHHQRTARLPSGRPGGEVARFDPQHALGGGANPAQRTNVDDPGGDARAGRHRVPRIRRQDPGRHPPRRRQEPAHGRSGADRRIRAVGQIDRARLGQGDRRRSRRHGLFRHAGRLRPRERRGRRDGKPDRTRPHQSIARRRQRARDAAPASDQEVRLCDHDHHSDRRRDHLRVRTSRPRHSVRRNVPGGDRHRGVDDPRRLAGPHHHHARDRRPADGGPQRHRAPSAGGRDAGLGRAHLLGQDRHADAHGNDGGVGRDRGRRPQGHRRRLRQRGPGAEGRRAGRQEPDARASGARLRALQRRRAAPGGRRVESRGRSDRGRALSVRRETRDRAAGGTGRLSAHRRHPVRIRTPVHGDLAQNAGRRRDPARQGRARGDPRRIATGSRTRLAPKPLDRAAFEQASDVLAGQGERVLALAWLPDPGVKAGSLGSGRSAEEPRAARPRRPPRSAAQGSDRGGEGMSRRRHPRDDDHRRPQDHRRGDRENARHRRRQDGGHRRRGRGNGHGDASGDGRQGRRVRAREPRAQAASRQGDSGQRASGGDDRRRRQRRAGA